MSRTLPDGRRVEAITLQGGGLTARILTLGAIVQDLRLEGVPHPLVLGCPEPADYFGPGRYLGAIVGRFANRIGGARFTLDGQTHEVSANFRGRHLLHGGAEGTDVQIWQIDAQEADRARLTLILPDGHMGFPGKMRIACTITLADRSLGFELEAISDRPTPCNLTHHGYFDLDGQGDIRGHTLRIDAASYLPVDDDLIPTGAIAPVHATQFDFRRPRRIGDFGYDHNFCLSEGDLPLREVAEAEGRLGLKMQVLTTAAGLQFYDGAQLKDVPGLGGRVYGPHAGFALEAQGWPDSVNRSGFPQSILRPGETWRMQVQYRFGDAPAGLG